MRTYKDKEELKDEINKSFEKYISEFDNIPESLKDKRIIQESDSEGKDEKERKTKDIWCKRQGGIGLCTK